MNSTRKVSRILASGLCVLAIGAGPVMAQASPTNVLRNGGFEQWDLGVTPLGPNPPTAWFPMGDPANLFEQRSVRFDRIEADATAAGSGLHSALVVAAEPDAFVAQSLEGHAAYRGRELTFEVDVSTLDDVATSVIEVDDGVTSSSRSAVVFARSAARLAVTHVVDAAATRVQVRIYPQSSLIIDAARVVVTDADAVAFFLAKSVPLGAVIDWWQFDPSIPVPSGYAICDGSVISDPSSPFDGEPTPDLVDRFVRGTDMTSLITDDAGGSDALNLSHSHGAGSHTHTGSVPAPGTSDATGDNSGLGTEIEFSQHGHGHSTLSIDPASGSTNPALGVVSALPPHARLLKIIRIK